MKNTIRIIALLLCTLFLLTACDQSKADVVVNDLVPAVTSSDQPKPDVVVNDFLTAVKAKDLVMAGAYLKIGSDSTLKDIDFENEAAMNMMYAFIDKLSFEIPVLKSVEGDRAIVEVSITTVDSLSLMPDIIVQMMPIALIMENEGAEIDEAIIESAAMDLISANVNNMGAPMATTIATLNLVKVDQEWKIVDDQALADALTGNFGTALENMGGF